MNIDELTKEDKTLVKLRMFMFTVSSLQKCLVCLALSTFPNCTFNWASHRHKVEGKPTIESKHLLYSNLWDSNKRICTRQLKLFPNYGTDLTSFKRSPLLQLVLQRDSLWKTHTYLLGLIKIVTRLYGNVKYRR